MLTTTEAQERILNDPDFVNLKRFNYSLEAVLAQFPDGCPDKLIATALLMTEDDVKNIEETITLKLRAAMKVDVDD